MTHEVRRQLRAKLRERKKARNRESKATPAAVKAARAKPVALPVLPCAHANELTGRERESGGHDHRKRWNWCDHPEQPLGKRVVCVCEGCGPKCNGYTAPG